MDADHMDFGAALGHVKEGNRIGRREWKNARFVFLVPGSTFEVNRPPLLGIYPEGTEITYRPHLDMVGADGRVGTWAPSVGDVLATDWFVVKDEDLKS